MDTKFTYAVDLWHPIRKFWVRLTDGEVRDCGIVYDIPTQKDRWEIALKSQTAGLYDPGMMIRLVRQYSLRPPGHNEMLCCAYKMGIDRIHWTCIFAAPVDLDKHWQYRPYWIQT